MANSSGSVTNQAIQVLQGPYITNTYGAGIQCQGPTMNFTPYVTGAVSAQKPFEDQYYDNVYDMRDLTCLLYTSPSPRDNRVSRMPSSA